MDTTKEHEIHGKLLEVFLPSQFTVTIREQNGNDDDIISNIADANDGSSINKFLSGIILESSISDKKIIPNDILKWRLKDKYYLLFKSRVHSLGYNLNFNFKCLNETCGVETAYEEDLNKYDCDLKKYIESEEKPKLNSKQITLYPTPLNGTDYRELNLDGGKRVRYKFLDGLGEKAMLKVKKEEISKNHELTCRGLQLLNEEGNRWDIIKNFRMFKANEMKQIRSDIEKNDTQFNVSTSITCPECKKTEQIFLITQPDFFFPVDR